MSESKPVKAASASDWNREDLPLKRSTIRLERAFSAEELETIQLGCVPQQMDDKWFIYWEGDTLYFHRSWTGYCSYAVRFRTVGGEHLMFEAEVNRDPEQYSETSDETDASLISYLVDAVLLRRPVEYPADPSDELGPIKAWSLVGRVLRGEHPEDEPAGPIVISEGDEGVQDEEQPQG